MPHLSEFEGSQVVAAGIEIPRAGGGLHDALKIEPRELHIDDKVTVVLELHCVKVRHEAIKDTDALVRVHVMDVDTATFIDEDLVEDVLAAHQERVEELHRQEEEQRGEPRLPGLDGGKEKGKK